MRWLLGFSILGASRDRRGYGAGVVRILIVLLLLALVFGFARDFRGDRWEDRLLAVRLTVTQISFTEVPTWGVRLHTH